MKRKTLSCLLSFSIIMSASNLSAIDINLDKNALQTGIIDKLTGGFGVNLGGLGSVNVFLKCDIPKINLNIDTDIDNICNNKTDAASVSDFFNKLSASIHIGSCTLSTNFQNNFNSMIKNNLCNNRDKLSAYTIDRIKTLETTEYEPYADTEINTTENNESFKNIHYPNGETTKSLYWEDDEGSPGLLSYNSISTGQVPQQLRQAYATDDPVIYEAYSNLAKIKSYSNSSEDNSEDEDYNSKSGNSNSFKTASNKDIIDSVPPTYLDYKADKEALINRYKTLVPTMSEYEANVRATIEALKDKYDFYNLKGSTAKELRKDYNQKLAKIINDLLSLDTNVTDKNSNATDKDSNDTRPFAHYIQGLRKLERIKYQYEIDKYKLDHPDEVVVQPSRKKVLIQPENNKVRYAYKITMQERREIYQELKFQERFNRLKDEIARFTLRILYDSLQYRPKIAQQEIKELLGVADDGSSSN